MRKLLCVPMMTLCLLLASCGTGEETTAQTLRQPYLDMEGCTMTAQIACARQDLAWEGTVACEYVPEGASTVEVLAPELIAGVKAVVEGETFSLSYEGEILNFVPLTEEELTPLNVLPRLMAALREGWLLEENREAWEETECIRLVVDQSGREKLITTCWLRLEDAAPLRSEIAAGEEVIFIVEFTDFSFCDMIHDQEEVSSGK